MSQSSSSGSGIGVTGLLGVIFVTLKILDIAPVSTWSWWWVTAPFWAGAVLVLVVLIIGIIVAMVRE